MSCCITLDQVGDWYDLEGAQPMEITDLVAYAYLHSPTDISGPGTKSRVTDFANQSWYPDPQLTLLSSPYCDPNGGDKAGNVANARQWMFSHKTWEDSSTLPLSLNKVMFMRGGLQWRMRLELAVWALAPIDEIYLAFRDNAGTRGDYAGTYPVIKWTSTGTGFDNHVHLFIDLKKLGRYNVVLWTKSKPFIGMPKEPAWSMTEMEWIVVE